MSKENFPYLHGFSQDEQTRLRKQARFLEQSLYKDINFSEAKKILEVGCGVGAQTEILLRRFPDLFVHGIDLNEKQLETAKNHLETLSWAKNRYQIERMNAEKMQLPSESFDGAFICLVLEHVPNPSKILSELRRVLKPGATVYITEVMNHTFFLDPYSPNVWKYWMAFNDFQYENAGDPFVGAKLGNLLYSQGFREIKGTPCTWHLDNRHPQKRKDFIDFWNELLMSGADALLDAGVVTEDIVHAAKKEMDSVASDPNAVFYYSLMQTKAKVL